MPSRSADIGEQSCRPNPRDRGSRRRDKGTNRVNNWGYWVVVNNSEISMLPCEAENIAWTGRGIMQFELVMVGDKSPTRRGLDFVIDTHAIQNYKWSCPPFSQFTCFWSALNHTEWPGLKGFQTLIGFLFSRLRRCLALV